MVSMIQRMIAIVLSVLTLAGLTACRTQTTDASEPGGAKQIATLCAVGDIFLTDDQIKAAAGHTGAYDFSQVFSSVSGELLGADLTVGNLEGNFTQTEPDAEMHSYPPALAQALAENGFDILQTANTYSIENGLAGLRATKQTIQNYGMQALGTYADESDREENAVCIREVNGIRIAFVAFTKGVNNVRLPEGTEYCVNLLYEDYDTNYSSVDQAGISAMLAKVKDAKPDLTVAMLHWGSEQSDSISQSQEKIEDILIQNGVDVILGSHSHLVGQMTQKHVTMQNGEEKTVFIAYSLGNFYGQSSERHNQESAILRLEFTKQGDGATSISDAAYTPIYLADNGEQAPLRFPVLNAKNALSLYESDYYDRVSEEQYNEIKKSIEYVNEQVQWNFEKP